MVSRENRVIAACIAVAIPLGLAVAAVEGVPDWAGYAIITVVGIFLPGYLTGRYRVGRDEREA